MTNYTQSQSSTTCYNGRPLWYNLGCHFDVMLITSHRVILLHTALASSYTKTYVWISTLPFCYNWLRRYQSLCIAKVVRRSSWSGKFSPMGFLGTFSMSFHIICWTYIEKNQLVTNLFNVQHVIPPNGPGLLLFDIICHS